MVRARARLRVRLCTCSSRRVSYLGACAGAVRVLLAPLSSPGAPPPPPRVPGSHDGCDGGGVLIGAATSLETLASLAAAAAAASGGNSSPLAAIGAALSAFASPQVRAAATLGGNLVNASPLSDLAPTLLAARARVLLAGGADGPRALPLSAFLTGYKRTALGATEVLVSVWLPHARPFEYVRAYKAARRADDDLCLCSAGVRVALEPVDGAAGAHWRVRDASVVLGGMAPVTRVSAAAAGALVGGAWDVRRLAAGAAAGIAADFAALRGSGVPGGAPEYRVAAACGLVLRALVDVDAALRDDVRLRGVGAAPLPPPLDSDLLSAGTAAADHRGVSVGAQEYDVPCAAPVEPADAASEAGRAAAAARHGVAAAAASVVGGVTAATTGAAAAAAAAVVEESGAGNDTAPGAVAVGAPLRHASGDVHATGEAVYVDDMPSPPRCLEAALVLSERAHARLVAVDTSRAAAMAGVARVLTAADVREGFTWLHGEPVLARGEVVYWGQIIAVVLAETRAGAARGAAAVAVSYEELPSLVSIADAAAAHSFFPNDHEVVDGDVDAALAAPGVILVSGSARIGAQEHFYMETNACLAVPGEGGAGMTVWASTQAPGPTQFAIAHLLGIPAHNITVKTKRLGGGFGGKETRSELFSNLCALGCAITGRPVRIALDRATDMTVTGRRMPWECTYRVGVTPTGDLVALDLALVGNGGAFVDMGAAVIARGVLLASGAYDFQTHRVRARLARTNLPPNTAFRGFGAPETMALTEIALEHAAAAARLPAATLRSRNLFEEGAVTPYGSRLHGCTLRALWREVHDRADIDARRAACAAFNAGSRCVCARACADAGCCVGCLPA
jgi:xanthine dehydrogenase/oxidase